LVAPCIYPNQMGIFAEWRLGAHLSRSGLLRPTINSIPPIPTPPTSTITINAHTGCQLNKLPQMNVSWFGCLTFCMLLCVALVFISLLKWRMQTLLPRSLVIGVPGIARFKCACSPRVAAGLLSGGACLGAIATGEF